MSCRNLMLFSLSSLLPWPVLSFCVIGLPPNIHHSPPALNLYIPPSPSKKPATKLLSYNHVSIPHDFTINMLPKPGQAPLPTSLDNRRRAPPEERCGAEILWLLAVCKLRLTLCSPEGTVQLHELPHLGELKQLRKTEENVVPGSTILTR
jgi:hypothetical protein